MLYIFRIRKEKKANFIYKITIFCPRILLYCTSLYVSQIHAWPIVYFGYQLFAESRHDNKRNTKTKLTQ